MGLTRKQVPSGPSAAAGSLAEALALVPEPRRPYGWSPGRSPLPLGGILPVAMAATVCGARSLDAIARWARERVEEHPESPVALGVPAGRSPSVATLHRVCTKLDVAALEAALGHRTPVRRGRPAGPTSVEVAYFITGLPPDRADAATLLRHQRGHWQIENRLHDVRDVTFDEDRSAVHSGAAPHTLAACRTLAMALLRRAGLASIAAGLRTFAGRPHTAIRLIAFAGLPR